MKVENGRQRREERREGERGRLRNAEQKKAIGGDRGFKKRKVANSNTENQGMEVNGE